MALNRVTLQGRLGRDPELRSTNSGIPVAGFSLAVDRDGKDTDWFEVVAWRNTAEFVVKYFQKGSQIIIDGRLQSRKWQDRDGKNRESVEVVADRVHFCGPKQAEGSNAPVAEAPVSAGFQPIEDDGDIPF